MSDRRTSAAAKSAKPPSDPATGRYRIQTVARLTGLGTPLLRQWERRHGLVDPERTASGYREYSDADVEVFRRARDLHARGLTIGEIAKVGRKALLAADSLDQLLPQNGEASSRRGSGFVEAFMAAIQRGAVDEAAETVARALNGNTLADAIEHFARPALWSVGEAWERGELGPGIERLATHVIRGPLEALLASANVGLGRVAAICAPGVGDTHEIGALLVALEIARAGARSLHLGGPLTVEHVVDVARASGVHAVCLSYVRQTRREQLVGGLKELRAQLPARVSLVVGGRAIRGLEDEVVALGVLVPRSIEEAAARIVGGRRA